MYVLDMYILHDKHNVRFDSNLGCYKIFHCEIIVINSSFYTISIMCNFIALF